MHTANAFDLSHRARASVVIDAPGFGGKAVLRPICTWPVYRFPLVMPLPQQGRLLATYQVTLIAEGLGQPTAIVSDGPNSQSVSGRYVYGEIANLLCKVYIEPLLGVSYEAVRWLHHEPESEWCREEWSEVTLRPGANGLKSTDFTKVVPVRPDWMGMRSPDGIVWRRHLSIVDPNDVDDNELDFMEVQDCYKAKMGVCSLDPSATVDDDPGETGYFRCRELAAFGRLWSMVYDAFGGAIPESRDPEDPVFAPTQILHAVRPQWEAEFGPTLDLIDRIATAVALFGGRGRSPIYLRCDREGAKMSLDDGRHRTCIARHLGCKVGAMVETPDGCSR